MENQLGGQPNKVQPNCHLYSLPYCNKRSTYRHCYNTDDIAYITTGDNIIKMDIYKPVSIVINQTATFTLTTGLVESEKMTYAKC